MTIYFRKIIMAVAALAAATSTGASVRSDELLQTGWQFSKVNDVGKPEKWQEVTVPHDWAIHEPFSRDNDLQVVAIEQNGETEKSIKTGRTGGLPYIGKGIYRTTFNVPDTAGRRFALVFDGAMSNPRVSVNGRYAGHWAYGYNSFSIDLAPGEVKPGKALLTVSAPGVRQAVLPIRVK